MTAESMIDHARTRFANNGSFSLHPGECIKEVVRREKVPNLPGVYIIFQSDDLQRPIYVGKAGTIKTDGSWKIQGIRKRLTMKQSGMYRSKFFSKLMAEKGISSLTFFWFVTYLQNSNIIPALAEMELLQAHYEQFGCLPELNKCV